MKNAEQLIDRLVEGTVTRLGGYNASRGAHTGTSGFTNFMGHPDIPKALNQVFQDNPHAVVIDGDDNWYAPPLMHPEATAKEARLSSSSFHSGVSGISKSGIVLKSEKDYARWLNFFDKLKKDPEYTLKRVQKGFPPRDYNSKTRHSLTVYTINGKHTRDFVSPGYKRRKDSY